MRLLFDQNLPRQLVRKLSDCYPGSAHIRDLRLERAADSEIWRFALQDSWTIVTKDRDFMQQVLTAAPRPKVVWIGVGNCSTREAEALLRRNLHRLRLFSEDANATVFTITR